MASVLITKACPFCKRRYQNVFDADAYRKWEHGMTVQDAFPDRSADDREFLITGICPECWDKMDRNPAPSVNIKRRKLGLTNKTGGK